MADLGRTTDLENPSGEGGRPSLKKQKRNNHNMQELHSRSGSLVSKDNFETGEPKKRKPTLEGTGAAKKKKMPSALPAHEKVTSTATAAASVSSLTSSTATVAASNTAAYITESPGAVPAPTASVSMLPTSAGPTAAYDPIGTPAPTAANDPRGTAANTSLASISATASVSMLPTSAGSTAAYDPNATPAPTAANDAANTPLASIAAAAAAITSEVTDFTDFGDAPNAAAAATETPGPLGAPTTVTVSTSMLSTFAVSAGSTAVIDPNGTTAPTALLASIDAGAPVFPDVTYWAEPSTTTADITESPDAVPADTAVLVSIMLPTSAGSTAAYDPSGTTAPTAANDPSGTAAAAAVTPDVTDFGDAPAAAAAATETPGALAAPTASASMLPTAATSAGSTAAYSTDVVDASTAAAGATEFSGALDAPTASASMLPTSAIDAGLTLSSENDYSSWGPLIFKKRHLLNLNERKCLVEAFLE